MEFFWLFVEVAFIKSFIRNSQKTTLGQHSPAKEWPILLVTPLLSSLDLLMDINSPNQLHLGLSKPCPSARSPISSQLVFQIKGMV